MHGSTQAGHKQGQIEQYKQQEHSNTLYWYSNMHRDIHIAYRCSEGEYTLRCCQGGWGMIMCLCVCKWEEMSFQASAKISKAGKWRRLKGRDLQTTEAAKEKKRSGKRFSVDTRGGKNAGVWCRALCSVWCVSLNHICEVCGSCMCECTKAKACDVVFYACLYRRLVKWMKVGGNVLGLADSQDQAGSIDLQLL